MSTTMPNQTLGLLAGGRTSPRTSRFVASRRRKERSAMYGSLHDVYAAARRHDMLADAEHDRRLNAIRRPAAIRRHVGAALIQTGRRVQGAHRAAPAATGVNATLLRTARS